MSKAFNFAKKIFQGENILLIEPAKLFKKKYKIVVFVPQNMVDDITFAMAEAGAGKIGNYTICSYRMNGEGTFKSGHASNPAIGRKGKFEKVNEVRLEMVCDESYIEGVIEKMLRSHPYEEPAFEIYNIYTAEKKITEDVVRVRLKKPIELCDIIGKINNKIEISLLSFINFKRKFSSLIIDFSGKDGLVSFGAIDSSGILKIIKRKNNEFLMSFNE